MKPTCPKCGSDRIQSNDIHVKDELKEKLHCRNCGQWWIREKKNESL